MFINIENFRNKMAEELEKTMHLKSVQVSGHTLQDALKKASIELSLPLKSLNYEVLKRGRLGILGLKAFPYRIIAYELVKQTPNNEIVEEIETILERNETPKIIHKDGRFALRFSSNGHVLLKIFPPIRHGLPVDKKKVYAELKQHEISNIKTSIIDKCIELSDAMWVKIGTYNHIPDNDFKIDISLSNNDMQAFISVEEPGYNGATVSVGDIKSALDYQGIKEGILQETIQEFEDFPVYNTKILVAQGLEPKDGSDAEIILEFQTEVKSVIKEREDGSVDFKEINRFQNVEKGQIVARKRPPGKGQNGYTVYGLMIIAKDGKDIDFNLGENVELSNDGNNALAKVNGHVLLKDGKICVEKILLIAGNVDIRVGNIDVLGSVEIRGNVEDGLSVKAEGNIHVSGYVGKANLEAGKNIIVARGINGGENDEYGIITAGKNIWASFIQNAEAKAGELVIVSSGIVNSRILAEKKVLCRGSKARIVGGYIYATEEVNAATLGTSSGTTTKIEVGFNPRLKNEINHLTTELKELQNIFTPLQLTLRKYSRQLKIKKKKFTKSQQQHFTEVNNQYQELSKKIKNLDNEIMERQEYMNSFQVHGRVSASGMVHAGVFIRINNAEYIVKQSYTYPVTFILKDDFVQITKYKDIEEDIEIRSKT